MPQPVIPSQSGEKIFNFSSGPGCLPKEVLNTANREMFSWQGTGISVMEMDYKSPEFKYISEQARQNLRDLLAIPDNFTVLFTQGGAQM